MNLAKDAKRVYESQRMISKGTVVGAMWTY